MLIGIDLNLTGSNGICLKVYFGNIRNNKTRVRVTTEQYLQADDDDDFQCQEGVTMTNNCKQTGSTIIASNKTRQEGRKGVLLVYDFELYF